MRLLSDPIKICLEFTEFTKFILMETIRAIINNSPCGHFEEKISNIPVSSLPLIAVSVIFDLRLDAVTRSNRVRESNARSVLRQWQTLSRSRSLKEGRSVPVSPTSPCVLSSSPGSQGKKTTYL